NLLSVGKEESKKDFRERLVAKIASWRVENSQGGLDITRVLQVELKMIANKIYQSKDQEIEHVKKGMIMYGSEDYNNLPGALHTACEKTFETLKSKFGYPYKTSWENIVFINSYKNLLN
ncbi:MAG: hypothetical protein K2X39_03830, partial [Silvanigrellaceae bacterium]|nr:hypothetical protein [Silvanigrellaceae bacterium]